MRVFVAICIFATASAARLGYDYGKQTDGFDGVQNNVFKPGYGFQAGLVGANDLTDPNVGPAEFEKQYFTFSAPESEFDDHSADSHNDLKRGLRVIFIKGPENSGLETAALQLAKSAAEQRSVIYVLSKQTDIGDLANKLNALNQNNANKPEVHFVKYRTPADAENAQRAIQHQYDGLGGKSSSHDGGVAPVLNFASKTPINGNSGYADVEPAKAYLPISKFI